MAIKPALNEVRLFLFDMDGTLYEGDRLFPFTKPLLSDIRRTGRDYLYMTNNSSKSTADYAAKMQRLGIDATEEEFITSAGATAVWLRQNAPKAALYVCGTASMKAELRQAGIRVTEEPDEATAVVVGTDTELTFGKLRDVCRILHSRDVLYLATHPDEIVPSEYGNLPDCGCLYEMIGKATGKWPQIIGKPEPLMPQMGMQRRGVTAAQTAVIGDRLNTDVQSGLAAGALSVLVMTGNTSPEELAACPPEQRPDIVLSSAGEIRLYIGT